MSTSTKILIGLLSCVLVGALVFMVYKQKEMADRQLAIQTQVVNQKELIDNIARSSNQYATKDDIDKFISDNGLNLKAIQDDLDSLKASISAVNVISVNSSGQHVSHVPSTGIGAVNPNTSVNIPDTYGYLKKAQLLDLHEDFGKIQVPIGQVGFSAWQKDPWTYSVLPRDYKITNVIGTDDQQRSYVYNKFTVTVNKKDYQVDITSAETKQEYPDPKWSFWNPKLFISIGGGPSFATQPVSGSIVSGQVTPSLNFGFVSYGRYKTTPDLSFAQVGVGVGVIDKRPQFTLTPVAYNIGKNLPFISNTYIGPSVGVGTSGSVSVLANLIIGL